MLPEASRGGDNGRHHDDATDTTTKPMGLGDAGDASMADDSRDIKNEPPTTAATPAPAGRRGSKKVRSGCVTCKKRKVKCDEAKPFCLRCTKTGRQCGGYLDLAALAANRRRRRHIVPAGSVGPGEAGEAGGAAPGKSPDTATAGLVLSSKLGVISGWTASDEERRAFAFFQEVTAPSLAGDLDAPFWRILVMQVCHAERAVRHAAMAVGALHEAFLKAEPMGFSASAATTLTGSDRAHQAFALQQYNTAISCLLEEMGSTSGPDQDGDIPQGGGKEGGETASRSPGDSSSSSSSSRANSRTNSTCTRSGQAASGSHAPWRRPVAPLMTCILFVCIEVMQGKDKVALIHLEQGRHILSQLDQRHQRRGNSLSSHSHLRPRQQSHRDPRDRMHPEHTDRADHTDHPDPDVAAIKKYLAPLYTRLSMTSFLFGGTPVPIPASLQWHHPDRSSTGSSGSATTPFDSVHSLRSAVHECIDSVLRFTQKARPAKYGAACGAGVHEHLEAEQHQLQAQLVQLHVALSLYQMGQAATPATAPGTEKQMLPCSRWQTQTATHPFANTSTKLPLSLLQIHLSVAEIWLATAMAACEIDYDAHLAAFSSIVSLAATILGAEPGFSAPNVTEWQPEKTAGKQGKQTRQGKQTHKTASTLENTMLAQPQPQRAVFTLETHVLPALYYVATKCRHRLVRHAALGLLMSHRGRRENLWRADVLGAIAARLIELEETGFAGGAGAGGVQQQQQQQTNYTGGTMANTNVKMPEQTPKMAKTELTTPIEAMPAGEPRALPAGSMQIGNETHLANRMHLEDHTPWHGQGLASPLTMDPAALAMQREEEDAAAAAATSDAAAAEWADELAVGLSQFWPSVFGENEAAGGEGDGDPPEDIPDIPGRDDKGDSKGDEGDGNEDEESDDCDDCEDSIEDDEDRNKQERGGSEDTEASGDTGRTGDTEESYERRGRSSPTPQRPLPAPYTTTESPFGVPEKARIHAAVIGAEEAGGSYVTVFRKPQGLDGPWNVQTEFVRVEVVELGM